MQTLDAKVWGPPYWFFLHTIALTFPHHPNAVTKKKYYEFLQNLYLFLPDEKIASNFSKLLDAYPVAPYLDSRESFVQWIHFIHNKINEQIEKPKISMETFYKNYYEAYKPKHEKNKWFAKLREKGVYFVILAVFFFLIYYFYNK